jgi:Protein of unknown function (DUF3606)
MADGTSTSCPLAAELSLAGRELEYWAAALGVTPSELHEALEAMATRAVAP